MRLLANILLSIAISALPALAGSEDDALRATALDYGMGWYTGDADRMESALHPDLAKRILKVDAETGNRTLEHMGATQLVEATGKGWGAKVPEETRRTDVTVLDVFGNAAVVKLEMHDWVDYLQMVKMEDRWVIVNVLWEMTPEAKAKYGRR